MKILLEDKNILVLFLVKREKEIIFRLFDQFKLKEIYISKIVKRKLFVRVDVFLTCTHYITLILLTFLVNKKKVDINEILLFDFVTPTSLA